MSTWIRTGTVTVTQGSNTIIGSGTDWVKEDVRSGWEVDIEGETKKLEVARVISATEIELIDAIDRTSAADLTYKIIPNQALNIDLRRKLDETLTVFAGVLSAHGAANYQIWLDAGNTGSIQDYLDSLVGPTGPERALRSATTTGAAQDVDFNNDFHVMTVDSAETTVTFSDTAALAVNAVRVIIKNLYDASPIEFLERHGDPLDVSVQEGLMQGIAWNPDATRFVLIGLGDFIYEFACPAPGEIEGAFYTGISVDVSGLDASPTGGFWFKSGREFALLGKAGDALHKLAQDDATRLGSISGINTATGVSVSIAAQDNAPEDVTLAEDESCFFIAGGQNDTLFKYTINTAGTIEGATYAGAAESKDVSAITSSLTGCEIVGNDVILVVGSDIDAIGFVRLQTPNSLVGATDGATTIPTTPDELQPTALSYNAVANRVHVGGPNGDGILEYEGYGLPCKITWPGTLGSYMLDLPAYGAETSVDLATTDGGASYSMTAQARADLVSPATVAAKPGVVYRKTVDASAMPGADDGVKLRAALLEVGVEGDVIVPYPMDCDCGTTSFKIPEGVRIIGRHGKVKKTEGTGSIFEAVSYGGSFEIIGLEIDAGGFNTSAVVMVRGAKGFKFLRNTVRNFSTNILDVQTSPANDVFCDAVIEDNIFEKPALKVGHPFLFRSVYNRPRSWRVRFHNNRFVGADPDNLPIAPGHYDPDNQWCADVVAGQGIHELSFVNNDISYSGAAGLSPLVRTSRNGRVIGNRLRLCMESLNIGAGYFAVVVDDATPLAEGHTVSWGAGTNGIVRAILAVPGGFEVRIEREIGVSIGPWPQPGDALVSATPLNANAMTISDFIPAASDFIIDGNLFEDCGLKNAATFHVVVDDVSTYAIGHEVSWPGGNVAEIAGIDGTTLQLQRLNDAAINDWPVAGDVITSATPLAGAAGVTVSFEGFFGELSSVYPMINLIYALRDGGEASVSRNVMKQAPHLGKCTHVVGLSHSECSLLANQPGYYEAPELYHQSGENSAFLSKGADWEMQLARSAGSELTIEAGAIVPTHKLHTVDTEGNAGSDEVVSIDTGNMRMGDVVTFRPVTGQRPVTFERGVALEMPHSITLRHPEDEISFRWLGADGVMAFASWNPAGSHLETLDILAADAALVDDSWVDIVGPLTIRAGETVGILARLFRRTTAAADLKIQFVTTGDVTGQFADADNGTEKALNTQIDYTTGAASTDRQEFFSGYLKGGAAGGTIKLQAGQLATDAGNPTTIDAGALIEVQRGSNG